MNILPFISAILIVFSIMSHFLLKDHRDTVIMKKSIEGYLNAYKKSQNSYEDFLCKSFKVKKKDIVKSEGQKDFKKKGGDKKSLKEEEENNNEEIFSCGQINIYPLLKNGKIEEKKIYEIFKKLIKMLYGRILKKENMEDYLLDKLIFITKDKKNLHLEKIDFKDQELQILWYKMLKGTKFYDFKNNIGYPSILNFIKISEKKERICINKAQKEILFVLFNKEIAKKILSTKNRNLKYIKIPLEIEHLIDLSHKNHEKKASIVICTDNNSKISIRKEFNF